MNDIKKFAREVRAELGRVEWPKLNDFIGSTIVTLMLIVAFAIYLGVVDRVIALVLKVIFSYSV